MLADSGAEAQDGGLEIRDAAIQIGYGHVFAGFMGYSHIAGAENYRFGSRVAQVGRFGPEGYGGGRAAGQGFEQDR
jgi:hypothetical protein